MDEQASFKEQVTLCLDDIRTQLQSHGGDCELVEIEGNTVKVRLQGACKGCPGAQMTLKNGIEKRLKEAIPQVEEVIAVE